MPTVKMTTAEWLRASRALSYPTKEQDAAHNKRLVTQVVYRHHYVTPYPGAPVEPLVIRQFARIGIARGFAAELMRRHDSIDRVELLKPDKRKEVIYRVPEAE